MWLLNDYFSSVVGCSVKNKVISTIKDYDEIFYVWLVALIVFLKYKEQWKNELTASFIVSFSIGLVHCFIIL